MQRANPTALFPPPGGRFAHAVVAPKNTRMAFIAGQVALDVDGQIVGPGDVEAQARQCFVNLKHVLDDIGARPQDVAQLTIYVADYDASKLALVDAGGDSAFGNDWPIAATTLVGVAALGIPDFLVEVSAVAVVPD